MIQTLQLDKLTQRISSDAKTFQEARPYPHIVLDDLLPHETSEHIRDTFPKPEWKYWHRFKDKLQFQKQSCDRIDLIPDPLDRVIYELNSAPFLDWLSQLSGISQILGDAWLNGCGLHSTSPGGFLLPHVDFHRVSSLKHHYRRLNLLLYLNQGWKESNRNSIALYYYTAYESGHFSGDDSTHWRPNSLDKRGTAHGFSRIAYRVFMVASSRFSRLAHFFNPNKTDQD